MQLLLVLFCSILVCAPAWTQQASAGDAYADGAGDAYADGFRAFERGDYVAALQLWAPLAERGDARAQLGLGLIYESGLGDTPTDREEALRWYRSAAQQGIPAAQNNLGLMYAEGVIVSRDLAQAVTLWRQAAEAGYAPAQRNLAVALEGGVGVERNQREAALWYRRAEGQGLTQARTGLVAPSQGEQGPVPGAGNEARGRLPANMLTAPSAPLAFYVQLASLRSQEDAARVGHELATRHADLLAGLEPTVRTVDLGGKGVWHRVLFGPIPSRENARVICGGLHARGGACLVAAPQPIAEAVSSSSAR